MMVNKRRTLLDYLKRVDVERYTALITKLGLRKYFPVSPANAGKTNEMSRNSVGRMGPTAPRTGSQTGCLRFLRPREHWARGS